MKRPEELTEIILDYVDRNCSLWLEIGDGEAREICNYILDLESEIRTLNLKVRDVEMFYADVSGKPLGEIK